MFILNVAKASTNAVNECRSNPCKQKPLDFRPFRTLHFQQFFLLKLTSTRAGFLYML